MASAAGEMAHAALRRVGRRLDEEAEAKSAHADEDSLGVGMSAFITALVCGFLLYLAMLFILQVAFQVGFVAIFLSSVARGFTGIYLRRSLSVHRSALPARIHLCLSPPAVLFNIRHPPTAKALRREQISIRNMDDKRDVRYKKRRREGLPEDFFLK